ncbi:MAG: hypothetical protein AB1791_22485 [Chloroflexota bacterium]
MTSLELTLTLPDDLARQARAAGLLTPEVIVNLIEGEVQRRQRVSALFAAADRLAALDIPPLTEAEIDAEIEAARRARRIGH